MVLAMAYILQSAFFQVMKYRMIHSLHMKTNRTCDQQIKGGYMERQVHSPVSLEAEKGRPIYIFTRRIELSIR